MTDIANARRLLVQRILEGDGQSPSAQRKSAFDNTELPGPIGKLLDKVARFAHRVGDEDVKSALGAGCSEDQLFELAVCAAVGQANRQYDAALAALAQAEEN